MRVWGRAKGGGHEGFGLGPKPWQVAPAVPAGRFHENGHTAHTHVYQTSMRAVLKVCYKQSLILGRYLCAWLSMSMRAREGSEGASVREVEWMVW
jgi:hypothetical protein